MEENEMGVAGGQGRTSAEVVVSAGMVGTLCVAFLAIVAAMVMAMITGCATTYHEKDGELRPNRPSAEEMREICPM
jgi:hypothetical protein